MSRLQGDEEAAHEDQPVGDAGLAQDLLRLIERFARGHVGLSVGAIVGDAEAAVGVGRTGVAVLSNSARSVDRLGMAIMEGLRPSSST